MKGESVKGKVGGGKESRDLLLLLLFFFFNDTATTEIYTLSLHDALPICHKSLSFSSDCYESQTRRLAAIGAT